MAPKPSLAQFHIDCVNSDCESITDMVDRARDITYETFCKHCDINPIAQKMGYASGSERGLHLKDDRLVTFHKSRFQGKPCYYMQHSRIEYVFIRPEDLRSTPQTHRACGNSPRLG